MQALHHASCGNSILIPSAVLPVDTQLDHDQHMLPSMHQFTQWKHKHAGLITVMRANARTCRVQGR